MKKHITKVDLARKLRKEATHAEKILWEELRRRQCYGLKFRRQHPLKEFIVDFFNFELNLVVEVDGGYHNHPEQQEKDELRDLKLKSLGYRILRFRNEDVIYSVSKVLEKIGAIKKEVVESGAHHTSVLSSRRGSPKNWSIINEGESSESPSPSKEKVGKRMTILSTKILTESQRELVLNSGIGLVEYDAIKIEFIDFEVSYDIENAIFTSQNAVKSFAKCHIERSEDISIKRCFCVGNKTEEALKDLGLHIVEVAKNASVLANKIVEKHSSHEFVFFCGNKRRDELPSLLKAKNIQLNEVEVYKTRLNKKTFERSFDAVMCFSPSGVQSYFEANQDVTSSAVEMHQEDQGQKRFSTTLELTNAICIGQTTAAEAKKYTENIVIANSTSIESVIAKAVKILRR